MWSKKPSFSIFEIRSEYLFIWFLIFFSTCSSRKCQLTKSLQTYRKAPSRSLTLTKTPLPSSRTHKIFPRFSGVTNIPKSSLRTFQQKLNLRNLKNYIWNSKNLIKVKKRGREKRDSKERKQKGEESRERKETATGRSRIPKGLKASLSCSLKIVSDCKWNENS